jgi:hypothetical protein
MPEDNAKKVLVFVGAALAGFALYKLLVEKKKPEEAIKESVGVVTGSAKAVVTSAKRFVKGSPEAKEFMRGLAAKRKNIGRKKKETSNPASKGGKATAALGPHKGHKTKKGLGMDQEKISQEKHEKKYRKGKK